MYCTTKSDMFKKKKNGCGQGSLQAKEHGTKFRKFTQPSYALTSKG